jgi:plasmid stability protein
MKKLTVVLDDDGLYTAVKVEAARRNRPVREIVAEALRAWLESQEDAELQGEIDAARAEWREKGGREAGQFFRELE